MADDRRTLWIEVELDDNGTAGKLRGMREEGDKAAKSMDRHRGFSDALRKTYTELSSKVNLLRDAWNTAASILQAPIEAAREETARNTELIASMKARGLATEENIRQVLAYSNAQSVALAIDDEQITKIQKIGLEYGNVALNELPAFVLATLGMAETTGKSFDASANSIARWVAGSTPKLKGMAVDVGKLANTHEKLDALQLETAGGLQSIIDKSNTFEGAQIKVNTAWGNTLSALGNMLTTSPQVIGLLQDMAGWIQTGAEWLGEHPGAIEDAGKAVVEWFGQDGDMQTALRGVAEITEGIVSAFQWISDNWQKVQGAATWLGEHTNIGINQETIMNPTGKAEPEAAPGPSMPDTYQDAEEFSGDTGSDGQFYTVDQIDAMSDDDVERLFASVKGVSRQLGSLRRAPSRYEGATRQASRAPSVAPTGAGTVHIGSMSSAAATQLARAIAGQGNLILAEAGVG